LNEKQYVTKVHIRKDHRGSRSLREGMIEVKDFKRHNPMEKMVNANGFPLRQGNQGEFGEEKLICMTIKGKEMRRWTGDKKGEE